MLVASAAIVLLRGAPLTRTTGTLAARFGLGKAPGGLLLLAVATNLPELAMVASAALRGDRSMAIGCRRRLPKLNTGADGVALVGIYIFGLAAVGVLGTS